jgi:hypothetical protein
MNEVILNMTSTRPWITMVFFALVEVITVTTTFDLWMSHGGLDAFALVVNYINNKWEPCHIMISVFKVHETLRVAMAL